MNLSVPLLARLAATAVVLAGLIGAPITFTSDLYPAVNAASARGGGGSGGGAGGSCRHGVPPTKASAPSRVGLAAGSTAPPAIPR